MNYDVGIRKKVHNTGGYDDSESRAAGIDFCKKVLGLDLISNPKKKSIDLVNRERTIGVELEKAKESKGGGKNYWNVENYKNMKSGFTFPTVNIPWWRKWMYWNRSLDPNYNKNIFIRFTYDFLCAIVIMPEVMLDETKGIDKRFQTTGTGTGEPEDFKCFKRKDVLTYTRKDLDSPWELDVPPAE
jgi:hypothetical protein